MLHEDETDTVLAGSTSEGTHDLLDRWFTKSVRRLWGWRNWKFLTDTIDLGWSGGGSNAAEGAILYLPNYVHRIPRS